MRTAPGHALAGESFQSYDAATDSEDAEDETSASASGPGGRGVSAAQHIAKEKALLRLFGLRSQDFGGEAPGASGDPVGERRAPDAERSEPAEPPEPSEHSALSGGSFVFEAAFFRAGDGGIPRGAFRPQVLETVAGVPHHRPDGWTQLRVVAPPRRAAGEEGPGPSPSGWPVAYHGTSVRHVRSVLDEGLRRPGDVLHTRSGRALGTVRREHGAAGSGEDGRAIYATPSLWCAAHPVYSRLEPLGPGQWLQLVLQLRVRPGGYVEQGNTLSEARWDPRVLLDPSRPDNWGIEWVVRRAEDVRLEAVLVRRLGQGADPAAYGALAAGFAPPPPPPAPGPRAGTREGARAGAGTGAAARAWTRLLEGRLRAAGHVVPQLGRLEVSGAAAVWRIPEADVRRMRRRECALSDAFTLGNLPGVSIRFYPLGDLRDDEVQPGFCTLRVGVGRLGEVAMRVAMGGKSAVLRHAFTRDASAPVGWRNFCSLEEALDGGEAAISVELLDPPRPGAGASHGAGSAPAHAGSPKTRSPLAAGLLHHLRGLVCGVPHGAASPAVVPELRRASSHQQEPAAPRTRVWRRTNSDIAPGG